MLISRSIHKAFYWAAMLAAVSMVFVAPYFSLNPVSHGQNMGGAIGAALAPVVYWVLLVAFVLVASIVAYTAARVADEPPEVRGRSWRPLLVGIATSAIFWVMFWVGLN